MSHWPNVPLGEVCEVLDSLRRPITKKDRRAGPVPYYGASGVLDHVEGQLFDEPLVLLGEDGAKWESGANSAFQIRGPAWVNNHAHVLRPRREMLADKWLVHYLNFANLLPFVTGLTVPKLNQEMMRGIPTPLPPLAEQQRVVAILDEALCGIDAATAASGKAVLNSKALFSSQLRRLFEVEGAAWPRKAIGEVAEARLGKMLDKLKNRGVLKPYVRNLNVRWFHFDLDHVLEMPFEESELEKYSAKRGDLLIVEGGHPGRAAIWDRDEPIFLQKAVHRVRFDDPLLGKILMYLLFAQNNDGTLKQHFSGAGIQHLTGQALARIPMPLPPVGERQRLVGRIEAMLNASNEIQRLNQSRVTALAELKQSLLARAFSGELTREPIVA